ncbi:helix-turn-helix domain-containing protein [Actinoplanes sp. M2I2]|uniref:helix-turn-helix domain-containing protein n=1 Tax=Actinoplanes sp. M2I2 TaxID=1734444 RepID=UPI002020073A|nr:helix-turn-helix domain-containing protein [Actinoplanes sp. M2I2]
MDGQADKNLGRYERDFIQGAHGVTGWPHAAEEFRPTRWATLGSVTVLRGSGGLCEDERPAAGGRPDNPGYLLTCAVDGRLLLRQGDRSTLVGQGDLALCDGAAPFRVGDFRYLDSVGHRSGRGCAYLVVRFPRRKLTTPPELVQRLMVRRIAGDRGLGSVLVQTAQRMVEEGSSLTPLDSARLERMLLDLINAVVSNAIESTVDAAGSDEAAAVFLRVQGFVQRHLTDPDLSPDTIASAHSMSVRSLHRLFRTQGVSVAAWIRVQRLERCGRDLADPALRNRPIYATAARWGFRDAAYFSKVFRSAYHMSPQQYRERMGAGGEPGTGFVPGTVANLQYGGAKG